MSFLDWGVTPGGPKDCALCLLRAGNTVWYRVAEAEVLKQPDPSPLPSSLSRYIDESHSTHPRAGPCTGVEEVELGHLWCQNRLERELWREILGKCPLLLLPPPPLPGGPGSLAQRRSLCFSEPSLPSPPPPAQDGKPWTLGVWGPLRGVTLRSAGGCL